jgi:protein SCO1/2
MIREPDALEGARSPRWRWLVLWPLTVLAGFALAIVGLSAIGLVRARPYAFHGLPVDPPAPASEFTLIDQNRQLVRLSDYRGRPALLYFGFTHCPDECPITLTTWKKVHAMLDADAAQVGFLVITVDPERDTPERLKEYLAAFSPDFLGLTGSPEEIEAVARAYAAYFVEVPITRAAPATEEAHSHESSATEADYLVDHTTLIHLIDRAGNLIRVYPYDAAAEDIAADILYLLDQSP